MSDSNVGSRTYTDPVALRALAHPLRLRLHALVGREGTLTAADAARQLGISHGLASHHLRQLAKYGFVEEAEAADGRAHPWRVTSTSYDVVSSDEDARGADDLLQRLAVQRAEQELTAWQARRTEADAALAHLAGAQSGLLYLTPAELEALLAGWRALVLPLVERRPIGQHQDRPEDAVPIGFTLVTVPLEPTEQGG